jgi:hypothetical protein
MNWDAVSRIFIAILLIGGILGMGVHYGTEEGAHYPYPDNADLKTSPNSYTSTQVFVFGTVEATNEDQDTARIRIESDQGPFTAEVRKFSTQRNIQTGGSVQVFGTFQGEYLIEADNVRVVNPSGASNIYKYIVSGIAAVLILVAFFQYWRVNIRTLSFEAK